MVVHPRHASKWLEDRLAPRSPLERALPWIAWPCIDFLESLDLTGLRVFEYGGGGSTLYFLRRGCHVTTVENSSIWAARISAAAVSHASHFELRIVEMPERPGVKEQALAETYVQQVSFGAPWDLVLVDGVDGVPSTRLACLALARHSMNPEGLVILDDSWRLEYAAASNLMAGWSHLAFEGLGPARLGVTRTDVYCTEDPPSRLRR